MIQRFHRELKDEHREQLLKINLHWFGLPFEGDQRVAQRVPGAYLIHTSGEIVNGYNLVIPVDSIAYRALKNGQMSEEELFVSNHLKTHSDADGFYFASVATAPHVKNFFKSRLAGAVAGQVLRAHKPVFAVAVNPAGNRIAQEIGMTPLPYNGPIRVPNRIPVGYEMQPFGFKRN